MEHSGYGMLRTIIGPIKAGKYMLAVCYSPDGKIIVTAEA
jgi:hypothetical protein